MATTKRRPAEYTDETSGFVPQDILSLDSLKSNTVALPNICRGIRAVGAGAVKLKTAAGNERIIPILAGETRWIAYTQIFDDGTTAIGLEGLV